MSIPNEGVIKQKRTPTIPPNQARGLEPSKYLFSYVNIKRPTHKVGQVYTKIDIKPSGLTKERLAFMKTQMRLLYDDK